jgi:hypothetical protein
MEYCVTDKPAFNPRDIAFLRLQMQYLAKPVVESLDKARDPRSPSAFLPIDALSNISNIPES